MLRHFKQLAKVPPQSYWQNLAILEPPEKHETLVIEIGAERWRMPLLNALFQCGNFVNSFRLLRIPAPAEFHSSKHYFTGFTSGTFPAGSKGVKAFPDVCFFPGSHCLRCREIEV